MWGCLWGYFAEDTGKARALPGMQVDTCLGAALVGLE
jgi:hypothetical protein